VSDVSSKKECRLVGYHRCLTKERRCKNAEMSRLLCIFVADEKECITDRADSVEMPAGEPSIRCRTRACGVTDRRRRVMYNCVCVEAKRIDGQRGCSSSEMEKTNKTKPKNKAPGCRPKRYRPPSCLGGWGPPRTWKR
jgi:hypothetical protein